MVLTISFLVYEIQHIIQKVAYEQLVRLRQPAEVLVGADCMHPPASTSAILAGRMQCAATSPNTFAIRAD